MQLKKAIAAGAIGAIMIGSTVAFAGDLSNFPKPFVENGSSSYLVVVGAAADPADVAGAIDVAARLGGEATVTTSVPVIGGGVGIAVTNGVSLDTSNTKIHFMQDSLNTAKSTLTSTDFPALASGSIVDNEGTEYKYDVYVDLGAATLTYNKVTSAGDPVPVIDAGGVSSANRFYTAKIVFQKPLDVNKTAGKTIKLFGTDYTLAPSYSNGGDLDNNTFTIFGGGEEVGIDWGMGTSPSQSVTVGGKTVSITVNGIRTGSTAYMGADFTIDSVQYTGQLEGTYITTASGVRIYVKGISLYGTGGAGRVVFKVGADKIKMDNGNSVKTGTTEDSIQGTQVLVSPSGLTTISQIQINVSAKDVDNQRIAEGTEMVDPVFKTFKTKFQGISPSLTATTRDEIKIAPSGNNYAAVTLTDYRGATKTLTIGQVLSSTSINLTDGTYLYHVSEANAIGLNEYTIINQGGFSHLLRFTNNDLTSSTPSVTLTDVFSNAQYKVYITAATSTGSAVIDGYTYTVTNASSTTLTISDGGNTNLFTPLRLKNGEEFVIARPTNIVNNTVYNVPGNATTAVDKWCSINLGSYNATGSVLCGRVNYTITNTAGQLSVFIGNNATASPNALTFAVIEEEGESGVRDTFTIPITIQTSPTTRTGMTSVTGSSLTLVSLSSNTYLSKGIDTYGTLVTQNSQDQGSITISYPDDRAVGLVFMGNSDMTVSGSGGSGTCVSTTVNKITSPVAKLDTEVTSTDKSTKNIISVGGPAVNKITAELLGLSFPTYGAASTIPQDKGMIKLVDNAFGQGKTALIIAGWNIADTKRATTAVVTGSGLTGAMKEV